MRTDTIIRNEGAQVQMEKLGLIEAEHFIMLIQKERIFWTGKKVGRWDFEKFEKFEDAL